jgi:hypothetical protein
VSSGDDEAGGETRRRMAHEQDFRGRRDVSRRHLLVEASMKPTIFLAALGMTTVLGCTPMHPWLSPAPGHATPAASVNQPSMVEGTSAEYDAGSSSTGSSKR